jgi:LAGLIDADG DNA endonuclease family protein
MTQKQKQAVVGMILGDAYLQKTGKQNARLRLEQSTAQKDYLSWKVSLLPEYFQQKMQFLERYNPVWKKTYYYVRIQSSASPEFGKLQRLFYSEQKKFIPDTIDKLLKSPLALSIWFMDDGYFYLRDKIASIYIPNYDIASQKNLLNALAVNFNLQPSIKQKKKGLVLIFSVNETKRLLEIIQPNIIPSMQYKILLDPVSTDRKSDVIG